MRTTTITLVLASLCFWLAWALMPGVGVTDTPTIFALVSAHRSQVLASVLLQLTSAALYVPAILGIASLGREASRMLWVGALCLGIGAVGSAADATYHLVAYEMTAPGIDLAAMEPVMRKLQGPDLVPLSPLLLAFFVGHVLLAIGVRKRGSVGRLAAWLIVAAPALGLAGALVSPRLAGLGVLGGFVASAIAVAISRPHIDGRHGRYDREPENPMSF